MHVCEYVCMYAKGEARLVCMYVYMFARMLQDEARTDIDDARLVRMYACMYVCMYIAI